jgi:FtsH-binding integral membrane protein
MLKEGMALSATARPIEGAVATLGVSDRVMFLRKTYAHLGGALIAFAVVTAVMMKYMTELSLKLSFAGRSGMGSMIVVLLLFVAVSYGAQKLAMSQTSRGLQYLGLGISVILWSILVQPMIWMTIAKFGTTDVIDVNNLLSPKATLVLGESAVITIAIFLGLTLTVFYTKKDFSFLRGALSIGMFFVIGMAFAGLIFGFSFGMLLSGFVILLMSGYILYQTSLIMNYFPPTMHVAAALMLFTTVVTLFIHVLRIVAEMNRR